MARLARDEIFDTSEIVAVHLIGKTVRSCYLMGFDENAGSKKSSNNSQPISELTFWPFRVFRITFIYCSGHGQTSLRPGTIPKFEFHSSWHGRNS